MISRNVLVLLVIGACVCPLAIVVVMGVARLLAAMQDTDAANVLDRIALGLGIVWAIELVCLVIAQGLNSLGPPGPPGQDS